MKQKDVQAAVAAEKRQAFITGLAQTGTVTAAAALAKVHRDTHYEWLKADPEYALAFESAQQEFADRIRHEVARRAMQGLKRSIYYKGVVCGQEIEYSDRLLELLAKAKCPEFREKHELIGEGGGPVRILSVRYPEKAPDAQAWAAKHKPKEIRK